MVEERAETLLGRLDLPVLADQGLRVHLQLRHLLFELLDHDGVVLLEERLIVDMLLLVRGPVGPPAVGLRRELVHRIHQRTQTRILDHVAIDPDAARELLIGAVDIVPRVDDEGELAEGRPRAHLFAELKAVHTRHHGVRHDQVDLLLLKQVQRLDAVVRT